MDARRPEKAEPGLQIGGLVIEAAQGAPGPRIQRTGRNDDRRPPRCMSDHIAAGVRRERKARLGQQVDIMLQPIGYSEVPQDRKSVGVGKSVSERVDLGGSRLIKKKRKYRTN